ncbi:MAG: hypothetical protein CL908_10745 [Deltaproteobacteria bacterium]|jgi:hypothetical protein|nr:hypothetical protein [Deltaproteobacteria bacterium]
MFCAAVVWKGECDGPRQDRFFGISVDKFTARHEDDGSVKILIAHQDPCPARKNGLNTLGHSESGMPGRIVGADGGRPDGWKTGVAKIAAL